MALTLLDDAYIEKPDWVNDGDPVSGHSGLDSGVMRNRPDGVANQLAAQLLSNLNMLRISRVNPMPSRFRHVNGLADTAAGGLVAPSGGLNAAAGDYIIVDYREAGANQAITRINLTGVTDGISVRLRRVPLDNGELPDVRVYQGTGSANPIIDGTGSRTWPTSPSRSSDASTVSGFGLDLSGQDAAGRSIDSATAARVDDLTFTYDSSKDGAVKWRAQPTALLEPSAQPILALLEQTRSALRTSIDTVATTGSVPASADSPGVVRLAGKAAASSRDSSTDDRAVTPAGVDAVMDGHEGSFAASSSAAGHVLLATDSELNQGTPPTGKAVTANQRGSATQFGLVRLISRSELTATTLSSSLSGRVVSAGEFRNYVSRFISKVHDVSTSIGTSLADSDRFLVSDESADGDPNKHLTAVNMAAYVRGKIVASDLPTIAVNKGGTGATTASGARTNLGLGSLATKNSVATGELPTVPVNKGGTGATTASGARSNLGLGSLATKNALVANDIPSIPASKVTSGTVSTGQLPTVPVNKGGTGATTASGARSNLGLGSLATKSSVAAGELPTVPVNKGGTGATTASGARTNLGLGSLATKNALVANDIPSIPASKVTSGTLPASQIPKATDSEVRAGTSDTKFVTPRGLRRAAATPGNLGSPSSSISWDVEAHPTATVTLTGNRTLNYSNAVEGGIYVLIVKQDNRGGRRINNLSTSNFNVGELGQPDLSTAFGSTTILTFMYLNSKMLFISQAPGY